MSHNSRTSILPPQQQKQRGRKKPAPDDEMFLPDHEIVGCLKDIGVHIEGPGELQRPNPAMVQKTFEGFVHLFCNATRETVEPAMAAAAQDVCGDLGDALMPTDARNLMGFYVALQRLMVESGIEDFTFKDLFKPTYERLVRHLSYLINFTRFRTSQEGPIEGRYEHAETIKARVEELYGSNQELEHRLEQMQRNRKTMEVIVAEKSRRNEELKKQLLELRRNQEGVGARLEEAKTRKGALAGVLEDKMATKLAIKQESAKLRPYVLQSPMALQASLAELQTILSQDKAHIDALDKRLRALQTSQDSFTGVAADVAHCVKLLDDVAIELAKEEDEEVKRAKQREALTERGANVREVERHEALLQRQLAKWQERTGTLRKSTQEKMQLAKERMEGLRTVHRRLTEERIEKGKDVERRRVRIEQTEKMMVDLKENIENEIHAAQDEYLKMDAHIKLYMTEMEQSL